MDGKWKRSGRQVDRRQRRLQYEPRLYSYHVLALVIATGIFIERGKVRYR